jgi:glycosyltransferase involved in cell wall biosynthesis
MKFSIVTAVYNGERDIKQLISSIRHQTFTDFEFIVIDALSTDKTECIIKENKDIVSQYVRESDEGIYDAWNKGIKIAKGDWILFLGSDDRMMPDALASYAHFMDTLPDSHHYDLITSRIEMADQQNRLIRIKGWPYEWPGILKEVMIAHPGALHSRMLFEKYGLFDCKYKISGDLELLLRAGADLRSAFMDRITVRMKEGGTSDSIAAMKEHYTAAVFTGKYPRHKAALNFLIVAGKFKIKKMARRAGINLYLKKP